MKAIFFALTLFIFGTMAAHAQTTKDKLEKVKADPKTKERAAKADVYIVKQPTMIADSSSTKNTAPVNSPSPSKKGKKKSA
jgi:hypothetical protein